MNSEIEIVKENQEEKNEEEIIKEEVEEIKEEEHEINLRSSNYDTLVLGGGAMKSFLLFGAMQYAIDNYFLTEVSTFIASYGGTMISFLLIIGYTPIEIITFLCTNHVVEKIQNFNMFAMMNGLGAVSFLHIYEELEKMTIEKIGYIPTFKDLKDKFNKEFICVTYNITDSKTEYISYENYPSLPCLIAIRMSSNLPLIFENFKYGNSYYIDGGVSNNFAIDIAISKGRKKILGIHNKIQNFSFTKDADFNILDYIYKVIFIPIAELNKVKLKSIPNDSSVDIISLDSDLNAFNFNLGTREKLDLFSNGYRQMKEYFEK